MSEAFHGLKQNVVKSIVDLQIAYQIGDTMRGELPNLPKPWKATSIGGDTFKLIAVAPELGIAVKRYMNPQHTRLVYANYEAVAGHVKAASFPLLLPMGMEGDAIVFPYVDIGNADDNLEAMQELKLLLSSTVLTLPLAKNLRRFTLKNKQYAYSDPFYDDITTLNEVVKTF